MLYKPKELGNLFSNSHFSEYPFVSIPQVFNDYRGSIANIADGALGDVAYIKSTKGSVRANHYHQNDWHLSYMTSGSMEYYWKDLDSEVINLAKVKEGDLIYTPPMTIHKMIFLENSSFIAISKMHRDQNSYESDTIRVEI